MANENEKLERAKRIVEIECAIELLRANGYKVEKERERFTFRV